MTINEKVVFIRKQMGYSQKEFAKELRISIDILKNIENARTALIDHPHIIQALSEFTQIPSKDITHGIVSMNSIAFTRTQRILGTETEDLNDKKENKKSPAHNENGGDKMISISQTNLKKLLSDNQLMKLRLDEIEGLLQLLNLTVGKIQADVISLKKGNASDVKPVQLSKKPGKK